VCAVLVQFSPLTDIINILLSLLCRSLTCISPVLQQVMSLTVPLLLA
jgi:hypothetical protein